MSAADTYIYDDTLENEMIEKPFLMLKPKIQIKLSPAL